MFSFFYTEAYNYNYLFLLGSKKILDIAWSKSKKVNVKIYAPVLTSKWSGVFILRTKSD